MYNVLKLAGVTTLDDHAMIFNRFWGQPRPPRGVSPRQGTRLLSQGLVAISALVGVPLRPAPCVRGDGDGDAGGLYLPILFTLFGSVILIFIILMTSVALLGVSTIS